MYEQILKYESETNMKFTETTQLEENHYRLIVSAKSPSLSQSHLFEATLTHTTSGVLASVITNYQLAASDIVRLNYHHSKDSCASSDIQIDMYCVCSTAASSS